MSGSRTKFPIYVISKGRWSRRQTVKLLERCDVEYTLVVEPEEYEKYAEVVEDPEKILVAPENFSEQGRGGIPVRNWVWERSLANGDEWHWILDDNIENFKRYNHNRRLKTFSPAPFLMVEDFISRYENIGQAGFNYHIFCPPKDARPPLIFNIRVYSCILQKNDLPYRWRGRWNEDTDLSLQILKGGLVTILFNTFLIDKRATMTQTGGCTDSLYKKKGDNRLAFAEALVEQHPDVAKVIKRWGRWHHYVDYSSFKSNKLIRKKNAIFPEGINEYGLNLYRNDGKEIEWLKKK